MAVFTILVTIKDAKNKDSTMEVNLPSTVTLANVSIFAIALAALIEPLIKGQITRVAIALNLPAALTGLRTAPLAGSDVEEGAKFVFNTTGGFITSTRIPTFDESKIASDSRLVDTSDTDVGAFIVTMTDGLVAAGGAEPVDKRGADVETLESALEAFQSSRA